ncbi:GntR family transcriptional regulator [Burkholderia sp. WAC0059]|uniref:GntR family transcriptional regulator n=1 Tax=Burkholderia sp. WAC0059 TaxID=2066022 RepID=UPI000C7F1D83|nr:GntR family transcriptional regulator [Burkholderia sp. WAC0059]PLZ03182.1 GntR family transcriptional regulator [Burkholderia sp. WAC0059]
MTAIDTAQSAGDLGTSAYNRLKAAVRSGELQAGDRLIEKDVTEMLGMSRTPVREALQRLESEGLLTYEPRRGLTVTRPNHQMIMELYTMREALESKAASLAAQHASDIEIAALASLVADEANYFDDPARLSEINQRIHSMMHLAAHNRYLLRSLQTMNDTMSLLPTMLGAPDRAREAHEEHVRIIAGIQARDPLVSGRAAEDHIRSAQRRRIQWLIESGNLRQQLADGS